MMVLSPSISCTDISDLTLGTCIGHIIGVVFAVDVPSIGHHQIEIGIVIDVCRDIGVVLNEFI